MNDVLAIPLVYSKKSTFTTEMVSFFDYLQFDLFTIENNTIKNKVVAPEDSQAFFEKIKDNTQYIIHPDEIMADNFMLALDSHLDDDYDGFSQEGRTLIDDLLILLKAF